MRQNAAKSKDLDSSEVGLLVAGLVLTALTAFYNIGFIALDDYYLVASVVPASLAPALHEIAAIPNVHPWVPKALLHSIVWPLWKLRINNPMLQIRVAMLLISTVHFLLIAFAALSFFPKRETKKRKTVLLLAGFYFACPLFFSRPMVESLSLPWLMVSLAFAAEFWRSRRLASLALATIILCLGSEIRFQIGVCWIAILAMVALKKDAKAWAVFLSVSLAGFLVTGLNDLYFTGTFHRGIRAYLAYNMEAGAKHGVMPWYVFLLLTMALTLPPAFVFDYRKFAWRKNYAGLFPAVVFLAIFLAAHSLSPHKEERFLIPMLPILLVLLTPLLVEFAGTWRVKYFWIVNTILLIVATTSVAQRNVLSLVDYLNQHPEIKVVYGVDGALVLFPSAFLAHAVEKRETVDPAVVYDSTCDTVWIAREGSEAAQSLALDVAPSEKFSPGWVEALVVKLNPKQNLRRAALLLFRPPCLAVK